MQTSSIVICDATLADAQLITSLSIRTFIDAFGKDNDPADMEQYLSEQMSLSKLSQELGDTGNHFILAYVDGVAAGYAKFKANHETSLSARNPLEIERIYVHCDYQGKKVGAALMRHCLSYAANNGHDIVWLGVWEHNHKAVSFYRQWGFDVFGDHPFLLGSDLQTDMLMKKVL